jgi:predicted nucleotidyltransferase
MFLDILHAQKNTIEAIGKTFGAERIRVFGSVARRAERPDSDVDLLVDLPQGYDLFTQRLPLAEELEALLGRKVDLIPEHEINRHLRPIILKEATDL